MTENTAPAEAHMLSFTEADMVSKYKTTTVEMRTDALQGLGELYKRYPVYKRRDILAKVIQAGLNYYGVQSD